jgi:hypothetical protein
MRQVCQWISAAVCAVALLAPAASALAAPDAAPGGLYWNGDFGNGAGFSQWHHVHDGAENAINGNTSAQLVSTPDSSDNLALSLVARPETSTASDRAEVGNDPSTNRGNEGQESYYHLAVNFPSSNKGNWAPKVWDHNNFFQFMGTDWAKPVMNMGIDTGDFGTQTPHMYFNFNVSANGVIDDRKGGRWDLGEVRYDSWNDFVIHVRWSKDSSGLLQAWMNGNEVVPARCARTLGNAPVIM